MKSLSGLKNTESGSALINNLPLKWHNVFLKMNFQGHSDQEIATAFGRLSYNTIARWRKAHKIASNYRGPKHSKNLSKAKKAAAKREKLTFGRKMILNEYAKSLKAGWTKPLKRFEAKVAEQLLNGPKTIFELQALLGCTPRFTLRAMVKKRLIIKKKCNHNTYYRLTDELRKRVPD